MLSYALRRIAGVIPTLFIIITLSFFVIRIAPGGPFDDEQTLPPEIKANLEAAYGLDKPLLEQYGRYLAGLVQGDFGPSFKFKDFSVTELIAQGLPVSLMLGLSAVLLALLVGIPLGTLAALRQNSPTDYGIMSVAVLGIALPGFVTGPLFALVFGLHLRWFPVAGWEAGESGGLIEGVRAVERSRLGEGTYVIRVAPSSRANIRPEDINT